MNDNVTYRDALRTGLKLHWYEIFSVLGQGGYGITYLGRDTNLNKSVAIKEYLPRELAIRDGNNTVQPRNGQQGEFYKNGLRRFIKEAQTLARFKHPNIVQVQSFFEANNTAYMVMEYERGNSLATFVENKRFRVETVLIEILLRIMDGLEQVHKVGFIHRDIKPANIFLRNDGTPVLIDFGSARYARHGEVSTLTSMVSPGFAPIEQYQGSEVHEGPWSDIYGLGATCYRLISGVAPVDALKRSVGLTVDGKDPYAPLADGEYNEFSMRFRDAVDVAMRFNWKHRPQSIAEWRSILLNGVATVPPKQPGTAGQPAASGAGPRRNTGGDTERYEAATGLGARVARKTTGPRRAVGITEPVSATSPHAITERAARVEPGPRTETFAIPNPASDPGSGDAPQTRAAAPPAGDPVQRESVRASGKPRAVVKGGAAKALQPRASSGGGEKARAPELSARRAEPEPVAISAVGAAPRNRRWAVAAGVAATITAAVIGWQLLDPTTVPTAPSVDERVAKAAIARATAERAAAELAAAEQAAAERAAQAEKAAAQRAAAVEQAAAERAAAERAAAERAAKRAVTEREAAERAAAVLAVAELAAARQEAAARRAAQQATNERQALEAAQRRDQQRVALTVTNLPPSPDTAPAADRPDIEVISELINEFERAFESRDLNRLERTANLSQGKRALLEQVFNTYSVIEVSISDLALLGAQGSASARMTVTRLLDQNGNRVIPGAWKEQQLVTRKEVGQWQKFEW